MIHKVEVIIPNELIKEIEGYATVEGITLNEFLLWALGEKVGELRERRGVKNLLRVIPNQATKKTPFDKATPPTYPQKRF